MVKLLSLNVLMGAGIFMGSMAGADECIDCHKIGLKKDEEIKALAGELRERKER